MFILEGQEEDDKPKKIKVIVRKPQPKLDPTRYIHLGYAELNFNFFPCFEFRLCGERGLKCLLDHFANFKPKGDGHEVRFLSVKTLMYKLNMN